MKRIVKKAMYAVAPRWTTALQSARARAHSHKVVKSWGCGSVNEKLVARFGNRVQDGPFAGLVLPPVTFAEQVGPYLLGVYESELDPAWDVILRGSYPQIIDIGAKFGYYAVGLARRYPDAEVIAFDTDWWARKAIREVAAANGVGNIAIKSFCGPKWLADHLSDGALVFSDCEGYEATVFGTADIHRLKSASLLIETHDCLVPGVTDRLRAVFDETHAIRVFEVTSVRRVPSVALDFLTERERSLAVEEVRPPQTWLLCQPRCDASRGTGKVC